jgi:hypothetical protein
VNSTIHICYIIYGDYFAKCVLTVSNDELAMRDDDDTSSEVAEGGHVWEGPGNSCGWTGR